MNIIEVKNIERVYGDVVKTYALRQVSFSIKHGEFVAIMGPSGSGKSTLMHVLGLLDSPTSGTYFFDGEDVSTLSSNALAELRNEKIGFVFQAFNLLPRTTVIKNVMLPIMYSKNRTQKETRAKEILEKVGLGHRLEYLTNQISGGEKQRVAIARALINNPSVVFADEPTGNLDSISGMQIMKILQDLHGDGCTVILVTHETKVAQCANRIITIVDGRIVSDEKTKNMHGIKTGETLK